jgi:hypothetical protein
MSNPEEYRHYAVSCMQLAARTSDPTEKAHLLEMARAWHNLIDQAERNGRTDLVYETPWPKAERRPIVQQQLQGTKAGLTRR